MLGNYQLQWIAQIHPHPALHFPEITQSCMVIVSKGNQVAMYMSIIHVSALRLGEPDSKPGLGESPYSV